jgi:oxalate---CoA ligase
MATLANALPSGGSTAIIVPAAGLTPLISLSFAALQARCFAFQRALAGLGIGHDSAVSIALPNSLELVVSIIPAKL